jgi:hypothetical protein
MIYDSQSYLIYTHPYRTVDYRNQIIFNIESLIEKYYETP